MPRCSDRLRPEVNDKKSAKSASGLSSANNEVMNWIRWGCKGGWWIEAMRSLPREPRPGPNFTTSPRSGPSRATTHTLLISNELPISSANTSNARFTTWLPLAIARWAPR